MSVLKPGQSVSVYQRIIDQVSVNHCAELCFAETSFYCLSFDIVFSAAAAAGGRDEGECKLSEHVAATADGLVIDTVNPQHNHYERIGQSVTSLSRRPFSACCLSTCMTISLALSCRI